MKEYMVLGLVEEGPDYSEWVDELATTDLDEARLCLTAIRKADPHGTFYLVEVLA